MVFDFPIAQPLRDNFYTIIVEAHPVDNRGVLRQAKQAGFVISFLSQGCNSANLYKTKSQAFQFPEVACIFIEARAQAYPVGKIECQELLSQMIFNWPVITVKPPAHKADGTNGFQRIHRKVVNGFRSEKE